MASSACFARFEIVAGALQFRSFSMLKYPMFGGATPVQTDMAAAVGLPGGERL